MRFGYTIIYVPDVEATLAFYEKAFGCKRGFVSDTKQYGELVTGETTLSFVVETFVEEKFGKFAKNRPNNLSAGFEVAFVTDDVTKAYEKAIKVGATPLKEPEQQPWGQVVAYVSDLNGVRVEICTPMG